jgi:hypothetical protein
MEMMTSSKVQYLKSFYLISFQSYLSPFPTSLILPLSHPEIFKLMA